MRITRGHALSRALSVAWRGVVRGRQKGCESELVENRYRQEIKRVAPLDISVSK